MNLPTKPPGLSTEAPITQLVTKLTDSQTLNAMIKAQRRRRTHPDRSALARLGGRARATARRAPRAARPHPPSSPLDKSDPVS